MFKKILALHFVKVMSCPNLPLLFVIVFWGETNRNILLQMFFKICLHNNFANFIGKHHCWSAFLMKLQMWRSAMLLKRDSITGVFLWIYFSKTPFLQNTSSGCFWTNLGDLYGSLYGKVILGHLAQISFIYPISC